MLDFRFPAEWEKQQSLWTAFPFDDDEWHDQLSAAQQEIANFIIALANHGQKTYLLCRNKPLELLASSLIDPSLDNKASLEYVIMPYGDIWLRDTGPITVIHDGERRAISFAFNGWGHKFLMEGDQKVAENIANHQNIEIMHNPMVFEGGAIDVDGIGNAVTTKQCLLHPNRNPNMSISEIETNLREQLALRNILWLEDGLMGDHTDGHIDNLARFIGPKHILIPESQDSHDPNAQIFEKAAAKAIDAGYEVSRIISVGSYSIDDEIVPASYMNFVIANDIIIVPQYDVHSDKDAIKTISALFPTKQVIGLISKALLSGGGSFHCSSQHIAAIE